MIYFKKVYFDHSEKSNIETALRKFAIKQFKLFDLETLSSNIGTDKFFFGFEGKKALYFTRVSASFERILPRVIVKLPKNETDFYYGFRLGTISSFILLLFSFIFIEAFVGFILEKISLSDFITILLFFLVFLGLIWIELKLATSRIQKAIINFQNSKN